MKVQHTTGLRWLIETLFTNFQEIIPVLHMVDNPSMTKFDHPINAKIKPLQEIEERLFPNNVGDSISKRGIDLMGIDAKERFEKVGTFT